jgi:hypothetical protein
MHSIWAPLRDFSMNFFGFGLKEKQKKNLSLISYRLNVMVGRFNGQILECKCFHIPLPEANSAVITR